LRVYVTSRAARILPALAVVTVLTVLVIGPIFTALPLGAYASSPTTWAYLVNMFPVLPQYELPGVFGGLPYPDVVNGSIWTLRAEFLCYLAVVLVGLFPPRLRPWLIGAAAVAAAIVAPMGLRLAGSDVSTTAEVLIYFAVGALLRAVVPRRALRADAALIVAVAWALVTWLVPAIAHPVSWVLLPYVVISIGMASTPVVRRAARFGDLSYGVYLWAFPTQQALLVLVPGLGAWESIAIVTPISALLALGSWHLVEKRAMTAKDRLPWMRRLRTVTAR
ncbi:MAG: acyltransferase family protein, partial [Microbacteriaceae bacterium]